MADIEALEFKKELGCKNNVKILNMEGAFNSNRYVSYKITPERTIYKTSNFQPNNSRGIITFPADINKKEEIIDNINKVINEYKKEYIIGKFLKGKYKNSKYSEESITVAINDISEKILIKISEKISEGEALLVKDYINGDLMFIN